MGRCCEARRPRRQLFRSDWDGVERPGGPGSAAIEHQLRAAGRGPARRQDRDAQARHRCDGRAVAPLDGAADLGRDGREVTDPFLDGHGHLLVLVNEIGQRATPPGAGRASPRAGSNGKRRPGGLHRTQFAPGWSTGKVGGEGKPPVRQHSQSGAIGEGRGVSGPAHRDCGPTRDALRPERVTQGVTPVGGPRNGAAGPGCRFLGSCHGEGATERKAAPPIALSSATRRADTASQR